LYQAEKNMYMMPADRHKNVSVHETVNI